MPRVPAAVKRLTGPQCVAITKRIRRVMLAIDALPLDLYIDKLDRSIRHYMQPPPAEREVDAEGIGALRYMRLIAKRLRRVREEER